MKLGHLLPQGGINGKFYGNLKPETILDQSPAQPKY